MRFHVLGLGPVGQLIAFHLRRALSPKHGVTLLFKTGALARRVRDFPLHIEHNGIVNSVSGFQTDSTHSLGGAEPLADSRDFENVTQGTLSAAARRQVATPLRDTVPVSNGTKDSGENHIDSLFVTCKAQSTLPAIQQVQHRLSQASTVVLLQNGNLATYEQLLEKVFAESHKRPNFILVSNTHGVWLKHGPFHTVHAGIGQLRLGIVPDGRRDFEKSLHNSANTNRMPRLSLDDIALPNNDPEVARYRSLRNTVAVLQKLPLLQSSWVPFSDMQIILRQKLVVNCVINPLTTILGCRNGEVFEHEAGKRMAYRICREASRVFQKEAIANRDPGVKPDEVYIPPELSLDSLLKECERVARVTQSNTSSMLVDLMKGKKVTEVDYLTGYLMTLGTRYNESVPVNASVLDLVKMRTEIPLDTIV